MQSPFVSWYQQHITTPANTALKLFRCHKRKHSHTYKNNNYQEWCGGLCLLFSKMWILLSLVISEVSKWLSLDLFTFSESLKCVQSGSCCPLPSAADTDFNPPRAFCQYREELYFPESYLTVLPTPRVVCMEELFYRGPHCRARFFSMWHFYSKAFHRKNFKVFPFMH